MLGLTLLVLELVLFAEPTIIPRAFWLRPAAAIVSTSSVILIDPDLAHEAGIQLAAGRLSDVLAQPILIWDGTTPPADAILILAAESASGRWVSGRYPPADDDSYWIGSTWLDGQPVTVVTGWGARGRAYGVFRLAELAAAGSPALAEPLDLAVSPAFVFRLTGDPLDPNYPNPEEALRRGYNAILIDAWPELTLFDRLDRRIYDPQVVPAERAWVEAKRAQARDRIVAAKRLGLQVVVPGDVITLPRRVGELSGDSVGTTAGRAVFCWDRPAVQGLIAASLDEVLTDFPEIDAVLVRTGENYAGGFLAGNPPHRATGCPVEPPTQRLRQVIDLVRAVVVDRHDRTYIQRAWDLGTATFHGDPSQANAITAGLPADSRLRFSFKHTRTDFWRYNEPNPNLANRQIERMIEFQAAREYEGKGAFPNFVGGLIGLGSPETRSSASLASLVALGVGSAWVWPKGGGWGGPALADDLWVDANRYALDHLLWEPGRNARELALEWAASRFGSATAPLIATLLEESPEIVLGALYPRAAGQSSDGWLPNQNWVRDDRVAGAVAVRPLYEAARRTGHFESTLAESAAARAQVEAWQHRLETTGEPPGYEPSWRAALASLHYQATLFATLDDYLAGLFYYFRWQDQGRRADADRDRAAERLRSALDNWRHHHAVAQADRFATPYLDAGLVDTIAAVFREMGGQPPTVEMPPTAETPSIAATPSLGGSSSTAARSSTGGSPPALGTPAEAGSPAGDVIPADGRPSLAAPAPDDDLGGSTGPDTSAGEVDSSSPDQLQGSIGLDRPDNSGAADGS